MIFFKEFFSSVRCFLQAFGFLNRYRLWGFFFIPALLNLIIFIFIGYLAFIYSGELIRYFGDLLQIETQTAVTIVQFLIALVVRTIIILIYLKLYRYLSLIFLAPVLVIMADRLYRINHPEGSPLNAKRIISDAWRGAGLALNNLIRELSLTAIILLGAILVPILAPAAPFVIFFIESYFYGFSMIDYFNEQKHMSAQQSRNFVWLHKGTTMGIGAMFNILILLPVIGVILAPQMALTGAYISLQKLNNP